jgi:peptidoglycan/LPS O-acetylase OafA/YrhL
MKKLDYIDALRGLAILGVLMVHTNQYGTTIANQIIAKIIVGGASGVQLFYLTSAFTLMLSFNNRGKTEKSPIQNFFIRRFFRIAPMYYLGILYYIFQDGLGPRYMLGNATQITVLNIISNFTFFHGFNPYWISSLVPGGWSIAVEMTFYAILPLLGTKITNGKTAFNFFIITLLLRLLFHLLLMNIHINNDDRLWEQYLFFYFPNQLPVFLLGILLYFICIEQESLEKLSKISVFIFLILLFFRYKLDTEFILPNHILFSIGFLFLGLFLSKYKFVLLVNPLIKYIGKISFSMYLVHFAILHYLMLFNSVNYFENNFLNFISRFCIVIFLTIIVASLFYNLIEVPFQNLGKKIIRKLNDV